MNKFDLNEPPPEEDELGVQENQPPEAHGVGLREGSNVEIDLNELPKPDGIWEVLIFFCWIILSKCFEISILRKSSSCFGRRKEFFVFM